MVPVYSLKFVVRSPKNPRAAKSRDIHSLERLNADSLKTWAKYVTPNRAGPARKSLTADAGFAQLLLGAGSAGVPVKIVSAPPKRDATLVYRKHISQHLYLLPKNQLRTGGQLRSVLVGPGNPDQTMNSLRAAGGFLAGRPKKVSEIASGKGQSPETVAIAGTAEQGHSLAQPQSLPELLKSLGFTVPRLIAPEGEKPVIWIQTPDWDRAGDAMKMAAMCAVAARPEMNGRAFSINLSEDLVKEALASPLGFTVFLQRRLKRFLKMVLPKADFAFAIDVTDETYRLHLHGVIVPNQPFLWTRSNGPNQLKQALRKFADNQSKQAVEASPFSDVPEGWGGYSTKFASLVTAMITEDDGRDRHQSTLLTTRPLAQLARDHWMTERRDNLAALIELARRDVDDRGEDPDRVVAKRSKPSSFQSKIKQDREQLKARDKEVRKANKKLFDEAMEEGEARRQQGAPARRFIRKPPDILLVED